MHTFRYNPAYKQWVVLGGPLHSHIEVSKGNLLDIGRTKNLVAASYPGSLFLLDRPEPVKDLHRPDRLYTDHPPIGEYELLLGGYKPGFFSWKASNWEEWLTLVQFRVIQAHRNPVVHYVNLTLATSQLDTVEGYERVGDFVATSHAIAGDSPVLTADLVEKIAEKEVMYKLSAGSDGFTYVPSAPLHEQEIWYIPTDGKSGIEHITKSERRAAAEALSEVFSHLHAAFPRHHYKIVLHTSLATHQSDAVWWIQIYCDTAPEGEVRILPYPEPFLRALRSALGHLR